MADFFDRRDNSVHSIGPTQPVSQPSRYRYGDFSGKPVKDPEFAQRPNPLPQRLTPSPKQQRKRSA